MSEQLPDTWHNRDLPVLRASVRGVDDRPQGGISGNELRDATGLDPEDVYRAVVALEHGGLLRHRPMWEGGDTIPSYFTVEAVNGQARQLAGSWPTEESALDRIIAALEAIAENTDDEDTRTRARKILDGFAGAGRQLGIAVAGAAITGQLPGAS